MHNKLDFFFVNSVKKLTNRSFVSPLVSVKFLSSKLILDL